jgi:glutamine synthetase
MTDPTQASGRLTYDKLVEEVQEGTIDTVITAVPDLYGRLIGKRITGHFFCEETVFQGMHMCNYLLACDMDMEPVPGYKFASWDKGYGDMLCVPDLTTLRRAAWLDRTAIVLCDVYENDGSTLITVAPRTILKHQVERARSQNYVAKGASEVEFFLLGESYDSAYQKGFHDLKPLGGLQKITIYSKEAKKNP